MVSILLSKQAEFSKDFDESLPALYEKMAVIYTEIYTHEDVKEMLKFYESPVGKKIAKNAGRYIKNLIPLVKNGVWNYRES